MVRTLTQTLTHHRFQILELLLSQLKTFKKYIDMYLSIAGCASVYGRKCLASTTTQEKVVMAMVAVR